MKLIDDLDDVGKIQPTEPKERLQVAVKFREVPNNERPKWQKAILWVVNFYTIKFLPFQEKVALKKAEIEVKMKMLIQDFRNSKITIKRK